MPDVMVVLAADEGEPIGIKPNDNMVVVEVQPGTICHGKIQLGDRIVTVNERNVNNPQDFYQVTKHAHPECRLVVHRGEGGSTASARGSAKGETEQPRAQPVPSDRVIMVDQRPGFSYALVELVWKPDGKKLGLGIKNDKHRVYVSRVERGSLADGTMRVGDRLMDVNGAPVSDMDVAKKMILAALMSAKRVSFVVEHPESEAAIAEAEASVRAPSAKAQQQPSMQMPSDVREIMDQERQRMAQPAAPPSKGILRKQSSNSDSEQRKKRVEVAQSDPAIINIRSDTAPGKNLRKIPKPP